MRSLARIVVRGACGVPGMLADLAGAVLEDACLSCEGALDAAIGPTCQACARRLATALVARRCPDCSAATSADGPCGACSVAGRRLRIHAPREHAGVARDLVIALKARRRVDVAEVLVQETLADPGVRRALAAAEVVVPVPGDPVRRRERGVDHAGLLASELARQARGMGLRMRALDALCFRWAGDRQAAAGARARRTRQRGRLRMRWLRAPLVRGRSVIVLDDVVTTGATAREAAQVLLGAGASAVEVVACTRAQGTLVDLGPRAGSP